MNSTASSSPQSVIAATMSVTPGIRRRVRRMGTGSGHAARLRESRMDAPLPEKQSELRPIPLPESGPCSMDDLQARRYMDAGRSERWVAEQSRRNHGSGLHRPEHIGQRSIKPTFQDYKGKAIALGNTNRTPPDNFLVQICQHEMPFRNTTGRRGRSRTYRRTGWRG
jgi:hypothetical protein